MGKDSPLPSAAEEPHTKLRLLTLHLSISVILWELVVRCLLGKYQRPYSEFPGIQLGYAIIIKTAKNGLRPTVPENMPPQFRELIQKAWDAEPANRPECSAILEELSAIEKYYHEHKTEWDALHTPPPKGKERPAPLLRYTCIFPPNLKQKTHNNLHL